MRSKIKLPALLADIDAIQRRIDEVSGKRMQQAVESLMRNKPIAAKKPAKKTAARKVAAKRSRRSG